MERAFRAVSMMLLVMMMLICFFAASKMPLFDIDMENGERLICHLLEMSRKGERGISFFAFCLQQCQLQAVLMERVRHTQYCNVWISFLNCLVEWLHSVNYVKKACWFEFYP